jgi:hypothetical protein
VLTTRHPLHPQKLALTSLTRCGRSVGIVCLRTKAAEVIQSGRTPSAVLGLVVLPSRGPVLSGWHGISNERPKFYHIISHLDHRYAAEVEDIIITPPQQDPLHKTADGAAEPAVPSRELCARQLHTLEAVGDHKPSSSRCSSGALPRTCRITTHPLDQLATRQYSSHSRLPSRGRAGCCGRLRGPHHQFRLPACTRKHWPTNGQRRAREAH